jgi:hypothetical protein
MKVKLSLVLLVVALTSIPALAQTGVAGKWVGELSAADGHGVSQPITLELKLDGQTLSGTVTEGALEARPILSAAAEGTTVTFRTTRNLGGSDINVNWKGELKGEDLSMTREIGPAPAEAAGGRGGGGRGGAAAGGRGGGGRGGAAPAAGGAAPAAGGAAPAAGAQRGAAAAAPAVPPVPTTPQAADAPDANAAAAGGRGGGAGRGGGGGRGGAAPAAAPAPGPTVSLTLHRSR